MYSRELEGHSLWAWTAAGASAPFAWILGSQNWTWTLGTGAVVLFLWLLAASKARGTEIPKWLTVPEWVLLTFMLSLVTEKCGACWITAENTGAIPVVLLTLAACSASSGCRAGARCGAVLFWFVAGMLLLIGAFSVPEVSLVNLAPRGGIPEAEAILPLLLPGAAVLLPRKKGKAPWQWALLLLMTAGAISALSAGVLTPGTAAETEGAFFEMARGISILGVAERFEAVVAAALTLGWFCLMSLLLAAAGHMAETLMKGWGRGAVWVSALTAWGLTFWNGSADPWLLCGFMVLLWLLLPVVLAKPETDTDSSLLQ